MNIFQKIGSGLATFGRDVAHFFEDFGKVDEAIRDLTPDARAAMVVIFSDLTAVINSVGTAVSSEGVNFSLDAQAYAAIVKLIEDAKADIPAAVMAIKALGITL